MPRRRGRGSGNQSLKFWYCSGTSVMDLRTRAMASCSTSRLAPETRTASPWMLACTLSLLSLISRTIFLPSSVSMPTLTLISSLTLLPLDLVGLAPLQATHVDVPLGELGGQHVVNLADLELVVGVQGEQLLAHARRVRRSP